MKEIAADVASGLIGPTPGLRTPAPRTPGVGQAAPGTPAPGTPAPQTPQVGVKRTLEAGEDEQDAKRIDDSASPRRSRRWMTPQLMCERQRVRLADRPPTRNTYIHQGMQVSMQ